MNKFRILHDAKQLDNDAAKRYFISPEYLAYRAVDRATCGTLETIARTPSPEEIEAAKKYLDIADKYLANSKEHKAYKSAHENYRAIEKKFFDEIEDASEKPIADKHWGGIRHAYNVAIERFVNAYKKADKVIQVDEIEETLKRNLEIIRNASGHFIEV